jgi:hypothetical protein
VLAQKFGEVPHRYGLFSISALGFTSSAGNENAGRHAVSLIQLSARAGCRDHHNVIASIVAAMANQAYE